MTDKRKEKKSETLEVRLPYSKKEAFKAACEREGITASHAMRTFIDAYLKQSRQRKLKQISQEITMKLFQNPLKTAGAVGAALTGAVLLTAAPSMAEDRDAAPINPPNLSPPIAMLQQGISAKCKALFDVSPMGEPENVKAECTHPGYIDAVIEAASTLRFEPKMIDGKAVPRTGVEYPIAFIFDQDSD